MITLNAPVTEKPEQAARVLSPKRPEPVESAEELERLQGAVIRYCRSLTASNWEAEDLAQETWLKAVQSFQRRGHPNPEAFLIRIAKNLWVDQARRKTKLARIERLERSDAGVWDSDGLEIEILFYALILRLSPLQRTVFLLRDVLGYPIAETAAALGTTEGAVKAALHRARLSLEGVRQELEGNALRLPSDPHMVSWLRALAQAYQAGDVAVLVQLAAEGNAEPAQAIGLLQQRIRLRAGQAQASSEMAFHATSRGSAGIMGMAA